MLISCKRQPLPIWCHLSYSPSITQKLKIQSILNTQECGSSAILHGINTCIEEICKSASKQTGMIYRKFYQNSSRKTLLNLYNVMSLIRLCLEHAAPVWDPSHQTLTQAVEKVQQFIFLKDVSKKLVHYIELQLTDSKLPTLKDRTLLKLSYLFQVMNGSFSFPNASLTLHQTRTLRNSECLLLERPIVRANA